MLLSQRDHRARAARLPATRASTRAELYRRVSRGRDFVRAAALSVPSLAAAAAEACLSPYHFQRNYTAAFGESPHATGRAVRLAHAARLLRDTGASVSEIAAAAGYDSFGAFSRAFRRQHGAAPSAFRKK
ncbi:MAG: helix-turn-helix transcriptional regulator [Opitutae bacterium]|nr:helix-turn-helix transcriptional regulator [Opitutae bacterium]